MSLVIAKRFGNRVLMLSDTKITDVTQRPNGNTRCGLKSIVINPTLTVSWAGLIDPALAAIREIKAWPEAPLGQVLEHLVKVATEHRENFQAFLVCAHEGEAAKLYKVIDLGVAQSADEYWIGDSAAADSFAKFLDQQNGNVWHAPPGLEIPASPAEMHLSFAFTRYLTTNSYSSVGNVAIQCVCSPFGHCYSNSAGAFSFESIAYGGDPELRRQEAVERETRNRTGQGLFSYNVQAVDVRGVAIVGVFLTQPSVGFLYDPLRHDYALKVANRDLSFFAGCVQGYALANCW